MKDLFPPPRRVTRGTAAVVGILLLSGLAMLTLTPPRIEDRMPNLVDRVVEVFHQLGWNRLGFTELEALANVLVFIPVGALAFVLLPRRIWVVSLFTGPAISVMIEGIQRLALPHRAATVNDVVANSLGATAGVALAIACTLLFASRSAQDPSPILEAS
ncbi:MAG: VanZ family protein [Microbacterium sp.]|uniref:VanZ family protein n=1 Tax=Microbacterium sp. TaxID=51671 RepID=UPI003BAE9923